MGRPVKKSYFALVNNLAAAVYVTGGSSAVAVTAPLKQVGSKRYQATTAQGSSRVTLVTTAPGAGEMRITATDSAGGTYFVKKLEENTVTLVPGTGVQFVLDQQVAWNYTTAVLNTSVKLN